MRKNIIPTIIFCLLLGTAMNSFAQKRLGKFKLEQNNSSDPDGGSLTKAQSILQALQWRTSLLVDENGNNPPSYYTNAVKQADALKANASNRAAGTTLQWQELGPGNIGGRTRSILYDNRDATRKTMYVGAVGGGLWKSLDGGEHWAQLTSVNSCLAVSCIAQDINGVIYFGTGEGLSQPFGTSRNSGTVGNGLHMLYGADLDSILPATVPTEISNSVTWCMINRIAINPANPLNILVATSSYGNNAGLEETQDGGQTWTIVGSSTIPISGLSTSHSAAADVKFSSDGTLAFASVGLQGYFPGVSLIESQDGGTTWAAVPVSSFPQFPNTVCRIEIGVAPSDPNVVYIVVATSNGNLGAIYKSADGGQTWSIIGQTGGVLSAPFGTDGQGWYDNVISVNPFNSDQVFFGGTQVYSYSSLFGGWTEASLYFGTAADPQWVHADIHSIVFNDKDSNEMWVGCDGGLFKSEDAFSDFPNPNYTTKNRGYGVTQNYSVGADLYGSVLGGAQDNGTNYVDYHNGATTYAVNVYGGDGVYAEISHFDPTIFVGGYVGGNDYRSNTSGVAWVDLFDAIIDPAGTFMPSICANEAPFVTAFWLEESTNAYNNIDSVTFADTITHYAGEVLTLTSHIKQSFQVTLTDSISAKDSVKFVDPLLSRLYFATYCGLWMTPDVLDFTNSPRWFRLTASGDDVKSLTASPTGDTIYFGFTAKIERMTGLNSVLAFDTASIGHNNILLNTGSRYEDTIITVVPANSTSNRLIEGIDADINNPNHVLCAVAGYSSSGQPHVYQSYDAGNSWTALGTTGASPLPNMPVYQCVIDYYNPNHYIIGTELGVWDSYDNGSTWTEQNSGINARLPVFRLRQQTYLTGECYSLYIGTHGRGMWRSTTLTSQAGCNVNALAVQTVKSSINNMLVYPNPLATAGKVQIELSTPSDVTLRVVDMPGRVIQQSFYSNMPQGKNMLDINTSNMANGTYLVVGTLANGQTMTRTVVVAK